MGYMTDPLLDDLLDHMSRPVDPAWLRWHDLHPGIMLGVLDSIRLRNAGWPILSPEDDPYPRIDGPQI